MLMNQLKSLFNKATEMVEESTGLKLNCRIVDESFEDFLRLELKFTIRGYDEPERDISIIRNSPSDFFDVRHGRHSPSSMIADAVQSMLTGKIQEVLFEYNYGTQKHLSDKHASYIHIGMSADVDKTESNEEFNGTVTGFRNKNVVVEDMDGDSFEVESHQLEVR